MEAAYWLRLQSDHQTCPQAMPIARHVSGRTRVSGSAIEPQQQAVPAFLIGIDCGVRAPGWRADRHSDRAGIAGAEKQIDVLRARPEQARAPLAQRQANERQAELNLGYTTITAPFEGTCGASSFSA